MSTEEESKSMAPSELQGENKSSSFVTGLPDQIDTRANTNSEVNTKKSSTADNSIDDLGASTAKEKSFLGDLTISPPRLEEYEEIKSKPESLFTSTTSSINPEEDGGEWNLLANKITGWWSNKNGSIDWSKTIQLGLLIIAIIIFFAGLQIYGKVLNAISEVPLAPRFLQFLGTVWLTKFFTTNLVRSEDRQKLIVGISTRWQKFLGYSEPSE